jgi:hypothetical protein
VASEHLVGVTLAGQAHATGEHVDAELALADLEQGLALDLQLRVQRQQGQPAPVDQGLSRVGPQAAVPAQLGLGGQVDVARGHAQAAALVAGAQLTAHGQLASVDRLPAAAAGDSGVERVGRLHDQRQLHRLRSRLRRRLRHGLGLRGG